MAKKMPTMEDGLRKVIDLFSRKDVYRVQVSPNWEDDSVLDVFGYDCDTPLEPSWQYRLYADQLYDVEFAAKIAGWRLSPEDGDTGWRICFYNSSATPNFDGAGTQAGERHHGQLLSSAVQTQEARTDTRAASAESRAVYPEKR